MSTIPTTIIWSAKWWRWSWREDWNLMDNMGNLPIYPLGKGGKKSWQLARTAVMIEVVGMMLIMRTNNKRLGQEEQYLPTPLPSPFGHTVSNIQRCIIGLVYITLQQSTLCNVSIGHSGSLQSLDRDRWWCEATKAPSEYRIAEPATKSMAFKKKSSFTIPAALSLASIIQKGGPHCQSCSNFLSFRAACYQTSFTSLVYQLGHCTQCTLRWRAKTSNVIFQADCSSAMGWGWCMEGFRF